MSSLTVMTAMLIAQTLFQKIQTDVPADGMRLTAEDYNKVIYSEFQRGLLN